MTRHFILKARKWNSNCLISIKHECYMDDWEEKPEVFKEMENDVKN